MFHEAHFRPLGRPRSTASATGNFSFVIGSVGSSPGLVGSGFSGVGVVYVFLLNSAYTVLSSVILFITY
jgi:hypothetical protein